MTTPIDAATVPLLPTKDVALRLRSFSGDVYRKDESSVVYRFLDAVAGDSGAGSLKKQLLLARLQQNLDTTAFTNLDNIFGNIARIPRLQSETYSYDPSSDLLKPEQWDEVKVKDAWYRARIKNFFAALNLGGTPDGIRMMVKAALGVDCEIYEVWRFIDHFQAIYGYDRGTVTNYVMNPSFETDTNNWSIITGGTGASLIATSQMAPAVHSGTNSVRFGSGQVISLPTIRSGLSAITPNRDYVASVYAYNPTANVASQMGITIRFYDSNNAQISAFGPTYVTVPRDTKTRISRSATAPANAVSITMEITANMTISGATVSDIYFFDGAMITQGTSPGTYYDGSTSGYAWTGVPHASTSNQASPIDNMSRLPTPPRNEIIVYPYKGAITALEKVIFNTMMKRLVPVDSILTLATTGMATNIPVPILNTQASSSFFQVQKYVTGAPGFVLNSNDFPNATHTWVRPGVEVKAPTYAYGEVQEYSVYYTYQQGSTTSAIDSGEYTSIDPVTGAISKETDFRQIAPKVTSWGPWIPYAKADSPDNYPGGKNGLHPKTKPAVYKDGKTKYQFPYASQRAYVIAVKRRITAGFKGWYNPAAFLTTKLPNGEVTDVKYRFPKEHTETIQKVYKPTDAVANSQPVRSSTVVASWYTT